MKSISLLVVTILSVIGCVISGVWMLVGFIIYLVKDDPFNWWSVALFVISLILAIVFTITGAIISEKASNEFNKKLRDARSNNKKSGFQVRLEEMENKRKAKQNETL